MSESNLPFEGGPVVTAPVDTVPDRDDKNRKLLVLGGLAGLVVLGVLSYFLVFAGSDDSAGSSGAAAVPAAGTAVPADPSAAAPVAVATKKRISAKSFGRDPFKALIADAALSTGDPVVGSVGSATTVTGTVGGSTAPAAPAPAAPAPVAPAPVAPAPVTPVVTADHLFRVVGVSTNGKTITVRVDGKSYSGLHAGDVFATYFKVVVIGGQVNGFQFGDEKFSVFGTKKLHIAA